MVLTRAAVLLLASTALASAQSLPSPQVITRPSNDNSNRAASTGYVDRATGALSSGISANASAIATETSRATTAEAALLPKSGDGSLVSTLGRTLAARAGDVANVLDAPYGADPTGAADSTAAFTAALSSGKRVVAPPGTYSVCGAVIPAFAELEGAGRDLTVLKARAGCNADVLLTSGAYSLFGTASGGGANSWQVSRLTIDGNRAAQTATGAAIDGVNCLAVYGAAWRLREVTLRNCLGHGLRSEWGDGGPPGGLEAGLLNVTIDTVGRNGWWFKGPHDTNATKMAIIDASQEADNTYDGLRIEGAGNGRFVDIHPWHRSTATNRMRYATYSSGSNQFIASHFEGGRSQLYHAGNYDTVAGSFIYAPFGATGSALVTFAGNNNTHIGNQYQGTSGVGAYALQVGLAGKTVVYNRVTDGQFVAFDTVGPFNFVNDGGANTISGYGYANPGGVTTLTGTASPASRINYVQGGTGINLSSLTPVAQIGDGTTANGAARGSGSVDLQTSRTASSQVAAGTNTGILSGSANVIGSGATASVIAGGAGSSTGNNSYAFIGGGLNNFAIAANSGVLGGQNNTASGIQSGVSYGSNNTADGFASTANGIWATARGLQGANAMAGGRFSVLGDAQRREVVLRGTGSSTTAIRLTADGGAAGASNCVTIADASAYSLGIRVIVRSVTTPASSYSWTLPIATLLRTSGAASTTVSLGTPTTLATNSFAPTVSATADTTLGCLNLSVTPPAGNTDTLRAVARVESVEVQ